MIKVENIEVFNFEGAIRGMRNPLNSWDKSDSYWNLEQVGRNHYDDVFHIGENDLNLMRRLYKAGTEHRKYLRQIFVSMDITTNQTVWAEFDTYKVGTTKNSCSKMHTIHIHPFEYDDFSHEGIDEIGGETFHMFFDYIRQLEWLRAEFNQTQEKKYWRALIEMLPMGYNLKATVTMSYENVMNIINQRENHKMFEWNELAKILKQMPYVEAIREGGDKC